nr:hypothetical protein BaRGS_018318 [Batillaria attramentaria]
MPKDEFFHYTPKDGEEVFIIDADFEPLQLETMTKEGILTMDVSIKSWMHAEYQLNEPPTNPVWFTPAQFAGDLVISRDGSHIAYFHMEVPNTRRLNVDMEWLLEGSKENPDDMRAGIGYMPKMEWTITDASHLPAEEQTAAENKNPEEQDLRGKTPEDLKKPDEFLWDSLIDRESALRFIETEFYPFKMALEKDENDPVMSEFAKTLLFEYEFPVTMMVIAPNRTIVHKVNTNDFFYMARSVFGTGLRKLLPLQYKRFLKEGLRKLKRGTVPAA